MEDIISLSEDQNQINYDVDSVLRYLEARRNITTGVYIASIILGVTFKILVITVTLLRQKASMVSAMNWLVVSLMAAGLLHLLFVLPMNIADTVNKGWHHGETFCQVHRYTWFVCLYSIAYHLVLIVVYLFLSLLLQKRGNSTLENPVVSILVASVLWVVILAANSANLISHGVMADNPNDPYCYPKEIYKNGRDSVKRWMLASFLAMYLIPAVLMVIFTGLVWWFVCTRSSSGYGRFDSDANARTRWDHCVTSSIVCGLFIICWSPRLIHAMKYAFEENTPFSLREMIASDVSAMVLHAVFPVIVPIVFLVCVREYRSVLSSWKCYCLVYLRNKLTGNRILQNEYPATTLEESEEL